MKQRLKAVATDCDGTLLRSDGTVSARTRRTLAAAEDAGIAVVLVTARPPRWMHELGDVVGGHGVALCGNGAFTYDVASRRIVGRRLIESALAEHLIADIKRVVPDVSLALESEYGLARESGFERASGRVDGQWFLGDLIDALEHAPGKILVRHREWEADRIHEAVSAVVGDRAVVSHSGSPGLAEIAAAGVSKGLALTEWCAEHQIGAGDVWAFGDMPNDLPMLQWAGRSFAVANAHQQVLDVVTDVCPSNDEDGVAETIDHALATDIHQPTTAEGGDR